MSERFARPLPGFRFAEVLVGDTIQRLALRELGDARRWPELVSINGLVPPYLTDDPALASGQVVAAGGMVVVPAPASVAGDQLDPVRVFERDIVLVDGQLGDDGLGDFALVEGLDNLRQFLCHLVATDKGELLFHATYGSALWSLVGTGNGANAALLAGEYVRSAIEADPRVREVASVRATAQGDAILLEVEVVPVSFSPFSLQFNVGASGVRF